MARQFEQPKPKQEPRGRQAIHEARWHTRGNDEYGTLADAKDETLAQIYAYKKTNPARFDAFVKVGAGMDGNDPEAFMSMMEKWEKDEPLTSDERTMRERARGEYINRLGLVTACEKLLTTGLFKGIRDHDHPVNQIVGSVGEEWALKLIAPRLVAHMGEPGGTQSLLELHTALREFHGAYQTRGFNKVYGRIDKYRSRYGITPQKWADVQKGGSFTEITGRAYGEFSKQHGWLGAAWYAIPNMTRAAKIGFAGWREEANSSMVRLRDMRTRALDVLGQVIGDDFQQLVDKAAKTNKPAEIQAAMKQKDAADAQMAQGMSEADILAARDTEWATYAATLGGTPTHDQYDEWVENQFKPAYEAHTAPTGGILMSILRALFNIRLSKMAPPAGVTPRPTP